MATNFHGLPGAPNSDGCAGPTSGYNGATGRRDGHLQRRRAVVAWRAHNPQVGGSTPPVATTGQLAHAAEHPGHIVTGQAGGRQGGQQPVKKGDELLPATAARPAGVVHAHGGAWTHR